jgi:hypothetical protein
MLTKPNSEDRLFQFDEVFEPAASQDFVFSNVAENLVEEVF